ncbi:MAG: hypothetical protein EOO50_09900 [Flavobacterium sp.]|uniref:hypothetical protein n=1 Tax=Flavobacterium sp. TaxID=239 RepID=UPI0011F4CF2C|nr:hypothetical protein [Flavobacterium sp.]RZJ66379.1 MAG: hypothetical protein EOO50_09900 [Flavobacterium sp.]
MANYIGKFDGYTLRVFDGGSVVGSIDFNRDNTTHADIFVHKNRYHVGPQDATEKDIVVTRARQTLFKFKFDYLWGGAEIETDGEETGFEVKGKWFKPGTRLVDADSNDIVIVKTNERSNELEISINDESISEVMLLSTIYYHVYASAGKLRSVMLGL